MGIHSDAAQRIRADLGKETVSWYRRHKFTFGAAYGTGLLARKAWSGTKNTLFQRVPRTWLWATGRPVEVINDPYGIQTQLRRDEQRHHRAQGELVRQAQQRERDRLAQEHKPRPPHQSREVNRENTRHQSRQAPSPAKTPGANTNARQAPVTQPERMTPLMTATTRLSHTPEGRAVTKLAETIHQMNPEEAHEASSVLQQIQFLQGTLAVLGEAMAAYSDRLLAANLHRRALDPLEESVESLELAASSARQSKRALTRMYEHQIEQEETKVTPLRAVP